MQTSIHEAINLLNIYVTQQSGKELNSTIEDWETCEIAHVGLIFIPVTVSPQWAFIVNDKVSPVRINGNFDIKDNASLSSLLEEIRMDKYLEEFSVNTDSIKRDDATKFFLSRKRSNKVKKTEAPRAAKSSNNKHRFKIRKPLQLGFIILIGLIASVSFFMYMFSGSVPPAKEFGTMDSLYKTACAELNVENCVIEEVFDNSPVGTLVKQTPEAGWYILLPNKVTLSYSKGPKDSIMPDVISMTEENAIAELEKIGVKVGKIIEENDPDTEEGRVISASVKTGDRIKNGDSLNLVIASANVELPDFSGKSKSAVELEAKALGLTLSFKEEGSDKAAGIVLDQSVKPGLVSTNENIVITISKPERTDFVKIPNVIGKDEASAQALLIAAGFSNITIIEVENNVTSTSVTHVVPSVDQAVGTNENIVLVVSKPLPK